MQRIFLDTDPVIALSLCLCVCVSVYHKHTHIPTKKTRQVNQSEIPLKFISSYFQSQHKCCLCLYCGVFFCAHIFFLLKGGGGRGGGLWSRCSCPSSSSSVYKVWLQVVSGASALAVRYKCWHFPVGEPHVAAAPGAIQALLAVYPSSNHNTLMSQFLLMKLV